MSNAPPPHARNRLLDVLPAKQRARFLHGCDSIDLVFGAVLCEAEQPFRHVYFPLTGFISLLAPISGHAPLEMGLIGDEGMLGATLILGVDTAGLLGIVQGSGSALRMSAAQFRRVVRDNPLLLRTLGRYLYVLMGQLSQSATCTHFHDVEARLARWLLMTHDRVHGDRLLLTHQFLADMLGVRRSAVTIAAGALQRRKLIRYTRGAVTVLTRRGLEAASCACYRTLRDQYDDMFA